MLISIWWLAAAFVAGGTVGIAGFALLAARAPEDDSVEYAEPQALH